jgi:lipoprotein-anchoring transpeptidase ErfK/SrfK
MIARSLLHQTPPPLRRFRGFSNFFTIRAREPFWAFWGFNSTNTGEGPIKVGMSRMYLSSVSYAALIAAVLSCGSAQAQQLFNVLQRPTQTQIAPQYLAEPQQAAPPDADIEDAELAPRLHRQIVTYPSREAPGTIIIDTSQTYLYYVLGGDQAIRYGIGVGRQGFTWSGVKAIVRKTEWPDWHPPPEMLKRQPYLPRMMSGGPGNPLGARAMYIGGTQYRIHGTNNPATIGKHVSSGCIRMTNDNAIDLYNRVKIGAKVIVLPQNGAPTREVKTKTPAQNWQAQAQAAIERSRQQAPQPLSYAPERQSQASITWNVISPSGIY